MPSPDPATWLVPPVGPWRGPAPVAEIDSAPFWDGLRRHELVILRCRECHTWVHPPQASCPRCLCLSLRPEPVSGRGTVYSFTVANREFAPGIEPPYVAALVDLDEQDGVRLVTNLVNVTVGDVRIGMPVRVVFCDLETIESALRIAETGHLTFATLHTNSAVSTINRIIDVFPSMQQAQVRAQLSLTLEGILCQTLLPKADGRGRALAMEILVPNAAIRNLIREDKVHQIYSMMQTGQDIHGMQTFNQSLATLFHKRQITRELAMQRSSNVNELRDLIDRGAGINNGNGSQSRAGVPPAHGQPGRVPARK